MRSRQFWIRLQLALVVALPACDSQPIEQAHPLTGTYQLEQVFGAYGIQEWQQVPALIMYSSSNSYWLLGGEMEVDENGFVSFTFRSASGDELCRPREPHGCEPPTQGQSETFDGKFAVGYAASVSSASETYQAKVLSFEDTSTLDVAGFKDAFNVEIFRFMVVPRS